MFFIFVVSKIKNLAAAVDFFGAFFFTILSFIAPILIYETNKSSKSTKFWFIINILIVIFGIGFGGSSAYISFIRMFSQHT